jgi:hypothetical protein
VLANLSEPATPAHSGARIRLGCLPAFAAISLARLYRLRNSERYRRGHGISPELPESVPQLPSPMCATQILTETEKRRRGFLRCATVLETFRELP